MPIGETMSRSTPTKFLCPTLLHRCRAFPLTGYLTAANATGGSLVKYLPPLTWTVGRSSPRIRLAVLCCGIYPKLPGPGPNTIALCYLAKAHLMPAGCSAPVSLHVRRGDRDVGAVARS